MNFLEVLPPACVTCSKTETPSYIRLHQLAIQPCQCLTLTKLCGACEVAVCLLVTGVHGPALFALTDE